MSTPKASNANVMRAGGLQEEAKDFVDYYVVFPSEDDPGLYEAHSIKTSQLGVGHTVEDAVYELAAAMIDLLGEAAKPKYNHEFGIYKMAEDHIVQKFLAPDTRAVHEAIIERIKGRLKASRIDDWVSAREVSESDDALEADGKETSPLSGQLTRELLAMA